RRSRTPMYDERVSARAKSASWRLNESQSDRPRGSRGARSSPRPGSSDHVNACATASFAPEFSSYNEVAPYLFYRTLGDSLNVLSTSAAATVFRPVALSRPIAFVPAFMGGRETAFPRR